MGGEKVGKCVQRGRHRGSPPRGRGKVHRCQIGPWLLGITPAWAGKSLSRSATVRSDKDHPRVGGEKLSVCGGICAGLGSPPRGRGKVPPCQFGYIWLGITPAWAGKRAQFERPPPLTQDHPRVGGEKRQIPYWKLRGRGSPPRGRGKDGPVPGAGSGDGITPAWAGKRRCLQEPPPSCGDHPRVGGEKTKKIP